MRWPRGRAVFALLLLPFLWGCPGREEPRLTFAVGGAPAEILFWEEIVRDFEETTGVAVELLRQPTDSDQRRQGLIIPLKARQPDPDVFLMDVVWLAQFAASGWLEPLDVPLKQTQMDPGVFFPQVTELVDRWEGDLVALPLYVDGGLLYYRRDLLRKYGYTAPPATWDDLVAMALRVQSGEAGENSRFTGFVWQGAQYEGLVCTFLEFVASGGGGLVVLPGETAVDTRANERGLSFMTDLIRTWEVSPPSTYTSMREEEVREVFQQGNALFERNWPYAWALHQREGSPVAGRVGIAPLPHFPGESSASTLGGWHVGISTLSDVKEEAWRLVAYLASYPVQKRMALTLGWNPGRRDVYADPEVLRKFPHFAPLRHVFDHLVPRPVVPYYTQVSAVLQRRLNAALAGAQPPPEALAAAAEEIRRTVGRYTD